MYVCLCIYLFTNLSIYLYIYIYIYRHTYTYAASVRLKSVDTPREEATIPVIIAMCTAHCPIARVTDHMLRAM